MANGQYIVEGDATRYNNFASSTNMIPLTYVFGDATNDQSTPAIDPADTSTQVFAVRMPSVGVLRHIKVWFKEESGGVATNPTIDFRIFNSPPGTERENKFDVIYERQNVLLDNPWDHVLPVEGVPFYNRLPYAGEDPSSTGTNRSVTLERQFLWVEIKPNDTTVVDPIVWVHLLFTV